MIFLFLLAVLTVQMAIATIRLWHLLAICMLCEVFQSDPMEEDSSGKHCFIILLPLSVNLKKLTKFPFFRVCFSVFIP